MLETTCSHALQLQPGHRCVAQRARPSATGGPRGARDELERLQETTGLSTLTMPTNLVCWGWSPAHAAYAGCKQRTRSVGHCAECRASCGYRLESATASAGDGRHYQAMTLGAELLLGTEGVVQGEYGRLEPAPEPEQELGGGAEVLSRAQLSRVAQLLSDGDGEEGGAAPSDAAGRARAERLAALLRPGSPGSGGGSDDDDDYGARRRRFARRRDGGSGRAALPSGGSPEPVSPVSEAHPWLRDTAAELPEELEDVVAQFKPATERKLATASLSGNSSCGRYCSLSERAVAAGLCGRVGGVGGGGGLTWAPASTVAAAAQKLVEASAAG